MRTRLGSARVVLLLICVMVVVLLLSAWGRDRSADAAPFSIAFAGATNSLPGVRGQYGIFAVTNRSESAVILLPGSRWSYENGRTSYASMTPMGRNVSLTLKPHEGRLLGFGEATNTPCRLEIAWIPALANTWWKVPLWIRGKLPSSFQGVRVRYQSSKWIREHGLINKESLSHVS